MSIFNKELCLWQCQRIKVLAVEHKLKVAGGVTAAVGILLTSFLLTGSSSLKDETASCEAMRGTTVPILDSCPWQMVLSDVTYRVRLLEMAFKEQAKARELLSLELYNHTDTSEMLQRKLEDFSMSLRKISHRIDRVNDRMDQLSTRLYSDECLGFLILLCLAVQILLVLRAKFLAYKTATTTTSMPNTTALAARPTPLAVCHACPTRHPPGTSTNNNTGSPVSTDKKNSPKMESCLVLFNHFKPNQQQVAPLLAACSSSSSSSSPSSSISTSSSSNKSSDETVNKLSLKTATVINSEESVQQCPTARLYLIIINSHFGNSGRSRHGEAKSSSHHHHAGTGNISSSASRSQSQQSQHHGHHQSSSRQQQSQHEIDLLTSFIRHTKMNGAQILMVVMNDESSMKLTNTSLYSTNNALIQGSELLLELAFNGRICTVWQELSLFQLNHVKKVYRSLVNMNSR